MKIMQEFNVDGLTIQVKPSEVKTDEQSGQPLNVLTGQLVLSEHIDVVPLSQISKLKLQRPANAPNAEYIVTGYEKQLVLMTWRVEFDRFTYMLKLKGRNVPEHFLDGIKSPAKFEYSTDWVIPSMVHTGEFIDGNTTVQLYSVDYDFYINDPKDQFDTTKASYGNLFEKIGGRLALRQLIKPDVVFQNLDRLTIHGGMPVYGKSASVAGAVVPYIVEHGVNIDDGEERYIEFTLKHKDGDDFADIQEENILDVKWVGDITDTGFEVQSASRTRVLDGGNHFRYTSTRVNLSTVDGNKQASVNIRNVLNWAYGQITLAFKEVDADGYDVYTLRVDDNPNKFVNALYNWNVV